MTISTKRIYGGVNLITEIFSLANTLYFPDYGNAVDLCYLMPLHFYFFVIFIQFIVIFNTARNYERENPNRNMDQTTRFPDLYPRD